MHKIFDLKEMEEEQLREIAAGLKIKGVKKLAKEDLVYRILDAEAVIDSQKEPEKPKKRGRPKKVQAQAAVQEAAVREALLALCACLKGEPLLDYVEYINKVNFQDIS